MGEAAEPSDHVAMLLGRGNEIGTSGFTLQQHRAVLVIQFLAVLEGHVEEIALDRAKLFVELPPDCFLGDRQGEVIGGELVGLAAKHASWKLVEQDHGSKGAQRIIDKGFNRQLALVGPELEKVLPDPVIELRAGIPPLPGLKPEPEFEDIGAPVLAQAAVPPTVKPSINRVG